MLQYFDIHLVKYSTSATPAVTTSTNGLVRSSTSQTGVTTTFAYDAFQREVSQTDGRSNTTRTVYDSLGRVASTIDALGYATAYGYDALGRQVSVTDPLTNTVTTAYDVEGRIVSQRGATYPVDYFYDEFGDKISMTTYRNINAIGDVTRWLRDEATGLVTNKVYADGKGPRYDYTPDGRLATRTWARGIVTTYSYDDNGALTNTVYSDGTPTISLVYNRGGQQIEAHDAAGVTTFLYDEFGSLTNETVRSDDALGVVTNTIERFYDCFARSLGYSLNGIRQSTLAYDPATGRLATMLANGSDTPFTWNYLAGSDLKSSLVYPNGLTASWQYDAKGQLLQVCNATPTNTISQYDYAYDPAGRRVTCAKSGSAFAQDDTLSYGYSEKSELTNAVASVDSDYRYAYDFDDIGNRETSSERGTNSVYTANNLNQYTAITDVAATPSSSQTFQPQFDDDGNQTLIKTATGIWSVTYNGENRPILWSCIQSNNSNNTNNQTISMSFDRMGRRVTKNAQRFVYDGYLQIANFEIVITNSQLTTHNPQLFVWDPTEPVATRPLVWNSSTFQPLNFSTLYYTHDGNKNVSEVANDVSEVSAHYEYDPFSAACIMRGEVAQSNPWRFSSEYAEDDSATIYYNYRHYDTANGRWLSRDPVVSRANLYGFVSNQLWDSDYRGLMSIRDLPYAFGEGGVSKELWRQPVGPGFVVLNFAGSIRVFSCCNTARAVRETWIAAEIEFELFYQVGYRKGERSTADKEKKFKGRDRNQKVPHPCKTGEVIKLKRYNAALAECKRKERGPKPWEPFGGGGVVINHCNECPNRLIDISGSVFIRASVGWGLGGIIQGEYTPTFEQPLSWDNFSGSAGVSWVGKGASVDAGGRVTVDISIPY